MDGIIEFMFSNSYSTTTLYFRITRNLLLPAGGGGDDDGDGATAMYLSLRIYLTCHIKYSIPKYNKTSSSVVPLLPSPIPILTVSIQVLLPI